MKTLVGYGLNTADTRIWQHGHSSLQSAVLLILNVIRSDPKSKEGQRVQFGQKQEVFIR